MLGTSWIDTPPGKIWNEDTTPFAFGPVRWYAVFITIGFIVAIVLSCLKMWKRYKISTEPFYWFILIGVPLAIFGANFGSCVLGGEAGKPWSQFWTHFGEGLAIEWGVLFVVAAAFIYFPLVLKSARYRVRDPFDTGHQVKRVSFWLYADAIMPCVLIAQFIGRWGNYMNQEVYGAIVTDNGLAKFLHDCLPYMWIKDHYVQPLFLWEGIANLGMFFIMYFGIEFIKQRKAGDIAAGYLLWYGALRLGLEPLRDAQFKSTATMVFSAIFVAVGAIFILLNHLVIAKYRKKKMFHTIIYKPIEKANKSWYPRQIKKWQIKCQVFENNHTATPQQKQEWETKVKTLQADWDRLQTKYSSQQYQDSFIRKEHEMVYFGKW